ncbi:MAG: hypothetical protein NT133_22685 [Alphaproteobacteria bacterium]|nr:hypothetical protein [Alphaproteobacteria bacterium]
MVFVSHDAVLADVATAPVTVIVTAAVDNYAVATLQSVSGPTLSGSAGNYTLNLGTVQVGGSAASATFGVLNSAPGLADLLSGSFTISGPNIASFTNTGFNGFGGLGAGQSESAQVVSLPSTLPVGAYTETIVLTPAGSNASGYNGVLNSQTITVSGVVVNIGITYNLTRAPVTITGGAGDDTFNATGGTLNSRDRLDGGGGTNALVLKGGGAFDLGAPAKLLNIQVVTASEGQAAMSTFGDTTQTVYLRDGLDLILNVAAGTPVAGNTNPESITIYGGLNNDVINLSTGNDTVVLAGAGTVVRGGSGKSLVKTPAAFASALVVGAGPGSSATTLEIINGGTVALNAGDNNIVVKLDAATNLTLNGMAFVSAIGQVQGNTIIAGAAGQTLGGIAGKDTLIGFPGFGNTFLGTAVGLNNDTIGNFGGSDIIDITNMNFATLQPLAYAAGVGKGVLTISDGTRTDKITLTGSYTVANFLAAADGAGGTAINWHA